MHLLFACVFPYGIDSETWVVVWKTIHILYEPCLYDHNNFLSFRIAACYHIIKCPSSHVSNKYKVNDGIKIAPTQIHYTNLAPTIITQHKGMVSE